jgi:hypothetical protein
VRGGGSEDSEESYNLDIITQWMNLPDENKFGTDIWWFIREHQTITHTFADLERCFVPRIANTPPPPY